MFQVAFSYSYTELNFCKKQYMYPQVLFRLSLFQIHLQRKELKISAMTTKVISVIFWSLLCCGECGNIASLLVSSAAGRMFGTVCPSSGNSGEEYLINNSFFLCPISSNSYSGLYACHRIHRDLNTKYNIFVFVRDFKPCCVSDVKIGSS